MTDAANNQNPKCAAEDMSNVLSHRTIVPARPL